MKKPSKKLIDLFEQMYQLTRPECDKCRAPRSCCSPEYCNMAEEHAAENYGIILEHTDHPTLPFMGPTGCTVAPYLRPMCTLHTCDINSVGVFITADRQVDVEKTDKYFELRDKIEHASRGKKLR